MEKKTNTENPTTGAQKAQDWQENHCYCRKRIENHIPKPLRYKSIMSYQPEPDRYEQTSYFRCGKSGLLLPRIALGLWQNFGREDDHTQARRSLYRAFDLGITHFDLANNYGPPPGSAEEFFGEIISGDLAPFRDELVISTKAGYRMWPGPYGEWGSRKGMLASLDQSLQRMRLDYVDIFYSHRPDPETPLVETVGALVTAVRQGKALYAGLSNYDPEIAAPALKMLRQEGVPCLAHQPPYNLFNRRIEENGLLSLLEEEGVGCIVFSPLAQGLLTDRYRDGIPNDSRMARNGFLKEKVWRAKRKKIEALREVANDRGQNLAQMALSWVLRDERVTTAIVGASRPQQIEENLKALENLEFSREEGYRLETILHGADEGEGNDK